MSLRTTALSMLQTAVPLTRHGTKHATADQKPNLPLAVITLAGTQEEMGRQHGELLREAGGWQPAVEYYPRMVEYMVVGKREHAIQAALPLALRPWIRLALDSLHRHRPRPFRARTEAFYEALGLPGAHARYLGVMDVLQNIIGLAGRLGIADIEERAMEYAAPACSTLALWGEATEDGRLLHARNFDFPGAGVWELGPVVVFCTPRDGLRYGFVTTRGADVPAVSVFNEAGISLTIHTRFHKEVDFTSATAVDLCHQVALRASTLEEAVTLLRSQRSASTWGIIVSSGSEQDAALVEMTAGRVAVTRPGTDEPWISCTNRYRDVTLQAGELQPSPGFEMHSDGRWRALERYAATATSGEPVTPQDLQLLLGAHGEGENLRAAGGVLAQSNGVHAVVIDPQRRAIDVAVGEVPVAQGPYVRVPWAWADVPSLHHVDVQALRDEHAAPAQHRYRTGHTGHAFDHFLAAARVEMMAGDAMTAREALEEACRLDPNEPTYRLLAAGYQLRQEDLSAALRHLKAGLAHEQAPFYRGRLLLWAARTAEVVGDTAQAQDWRSELIALRHDHIGRYQRAARREQRHPLSRRRLIRTRVQIQLCDLAA